MGVRAGQMDEALEEVHDGFLSFAVGPGRCAGNAEEDRRIAWGMLQNLCKSGGL
jgi:hypothetical protein